MLSMMLQKHIKFGRRRKENELTYTAATSVAESLSLRPCERSGSMGESTSETNVVANACRFPLGVPDRLACDELVENDERAGRS